jgi:hypothetical protein
MTRKELLIVSLSFGVFLLILNQTALYLNLFWALWWLDVLFHVVGGFAVGCFVLSLFVVRGSAFWDAVRTVFLVTLLVALVWEFYEIILYKEFAIGTYEHAIDTFTDVLFGLAGGLIALFFVPRAVWKQERSSP